MTSILIALAVVALVVYGLERNNRRQIRLGARMAGSTDVEDRDLPRMTGELHAATAHTAPRPRSAPRWSVRPARSA